MAYDIITGKWTPDIQSNKLNFKSYNDILKNKNSDIFGTDYSKIFNTYDKVKKDDDKKSTDATNFKSTMGAVSMLADPILGMGEQLATGLGANIKKKDEISGGIDMLAPLADLALPGLGTGLKLLDTLDRSFGKTTKGVDINAGSGFTGSNVTEEGKQFRFTQGNVANKWMKDLNERAQIASKAKNLVDKSNFKLDASGAAAGNTYQNNANQLTNNFNNKIFLSKEGSKLEKLKELKAKKIKGIPSIKNKQELPLNDTKESELVNKAKDFDSGGFKINKDKVTLAQHGSVVDGQETLGKEGMAINIIPEGALHARKHNLEDTNNEMTKKGIPVITVAKEGDILDEETQEKAKGGEIIQHAEIEKEEVILHLDLTKQLEELMKDGSDEAKIKAGKLLAKELMENTQDNTDLTEKLLSNEN